MNQIAIREPGTRSVLIDMSDRYGMEPAAFEATLRATVVPGNCSREQFSAFLLVAKEYKLNPLLKEIYAFPSKGGIQPIVGVDGWANLINSHPAFDGMDFEDHFNDAGDLVSITCKMHRKDRSHPITATEYLTECKRVTEPWQKWPRRMLRHKAMIQAARYAFSFAGIIDPDEAERFAGEFAQDVTPRAQIVPISQRIASSSNGGASTQIEPREQFSNTQVAEAVTTEADPAHVGQAGERPVEFSSSQSVPHSALSETKKPASVPPADAGNQSETEAQRGSVLADNVTSPTAPKVSEQEPLLNGSGAVHDRVSESAAPSLLPPDWQSVYLTAMSRVTDKPKSLTNRHTEALTMFGAEPNDAEFAWITAVYQITEDRLQGKIKKSEADKLIAELSDG